MHIEKNFFDNIFNTIMNVEGKTKDNAKSREDLKELCSCPELHRDETTNKFLRLVTVWRRMQRKLCANG